MHGVFGGGPYVDWNAELDLTEPNALQLRGGAWNLWPQVMRAGQELPYAAFTRGPAFGFRLVQTLP